VEALNGPAGWHLVSTGASHWPEHAAVAGDDRREILRCCYRPVALALGADPEGIAYGGLLELLYEADIPPARFFAEVLQLWQDLADLRRTVRGAADHPGFESNIPSGRESPWPEGFSGRLSTGRVRERTSHRSPPDLCRRAPLRLVQ
jgi:hypothetical protein